MRRYPREVLAAIPAFLKPAEPVPSSEEKLLARKMCAHFLGPDEVPPYMDDLIRSFRLLRGMRNYVRVGTCNKGDLAYAARQLDRNATVVDLDGAIHTGHTERLKAVLQQGQKLHSIPATDDLNANARSIQDALGGQRADAFFIDANHAAPDVISNYAVYSELVRPGGLLFFHDVYWQGDETCLGTAHALSQVDRFTPVHVVWGSADPIHRFLPMLLRDTVWGGMGIIQKA